MAEPVALVKPLGGIERRALELRRRAAMELMNEGELEGWEALLAIVAPTEALREATLAEAQRST